MMRVEELSKTTPPKWEFLTWSTSQSMIKRARMPGGWLVQLWRVSLFEDAVSLGTTFIPDPAHEWDGGFLP